jgi:uncharacterized protein (UPF0548 family)
MHVTGFNVSVSDSIINWSVSVSIFVFRFWFTVISIFRYVYCYDRFQVSSYRYGSLSVFKVRSLERGGVSEPSQAQVDR